MLESVEMCAGAGGQALGLEQAGFEHRALIEIDHHACATLRLNRSAWSVFEHDLETFDGRAFRGIDLLAGGLPCPPFSVAGKQLGTADERNLFPAGLRLVDEIRPRAVLIENVRGILDPVFSDYRQHIVSTLNKLNYEADWRLLNASDFGVPQLRPRVALVAIERGSADQFTWPTMSGVQSTSVGEALYDLISSRGWLGASEWAKCANSIAPTIVGGSKKHGGPDLGPSRSKRAWEALGVDGMGIADEAPSPDFIGLPRLTVRMVARLQGFPDAWRFSGKKTSAYRQVGNAFPPPVARALGEHIRACLSQRKVYKVAV